MSALCAHQPVDDPTIGRSSMPLLKGLPGTPMTGETRAGGSGTSRTDFERIGMDIDATKGIGTGAFPQPAPRADDAPATGEFARVFDLAEARRRRMTGPDRIPDEVWDDITRAGQLADDLSARGQHVQFDTHRLTNRVVASLVDEDGRFLRPVELGEIFGTEPDPAPAAEPGGRMAGNPDSRLVSGNGPAAINDRLMQVEKLPPNKIPLRQGATAKKQSLPQDIPA